MTADPLQVRLNPLHTRQLPCLSEALYIRPIRIVHDRSPDRYVQRTLFSNSVDIRTHSHHHTRVHDDEGGFKDVLSRSPSSLRLRDKNSGGSGAEASITSINKESTSLVLC